MKKLNVVIVNASFLKFVENYEKENVFVIATTNDTVTAHKVSELVNSKSAEQKCSEEIKIKKIYLVNVLPSVLEYCVLGDAEYRETRTLVKDIKFTAEADNIDFAKMIREFSKICKNTRVVSMNAYGKVTFNDKLDINIKLYNINNNRTNFHSEKSVQYGLSALRQMWKQQMPYKLEYSSVKTNIGGNIVTKDIFNPNAEPIKKYDPNDRLTVWLQNSAKAYKLKEFIKNDKIVDLKYKLPRVYNNTDGKPRGLQIIEQPVYEGSPVLKRSYVMGFNNLTKFDEVRRTIIALPAARIEYYHRTNWVQRKNDMDDNETLPFFFGYSYKTVRVGIIKALETLLQIEYGRYKDYRLSAQDLYTAFFSLEELDYVSGSCMTIFTRKPAIKSIDNYVYDWFKHEDVISAYNTIKDYVEKEGIYCKLPKVLTFNLEPEIGRAFEDTTEDEVDVDKIDYNEMQSDYKQKNINIHLSNLNRLENALNTVWRDVYGTVNIIMDENYNIPKEQIDTDFLDNTYVCKVVMNGITFKSVESAIQYFKAASVKDAIMFVNMDGKTASAIGQTIKPVANWSYIKNDVITDAINSKFDNNPELEQKLEKIGMTREACIKSACFPNK